MDERRWTAGRRALVWVAVLLAGLLWLSASGWAEEMLYTYSVVGQYPHDPRAFTQGLLFHDGVLYESTGLYGRSSLRRVALATGEVLQQRDLPPTFFGEGLTLWQDRLIQVTWREEIAFVYDRESFELLHTWSYVGEGWGLTHDGERLIMSDGSSTLTFRDPETFAVLGTVDVSSQQGPVTMLNELAYIEGEVWANIWLTDTIVRIDPINGRVLGWVDLTGLLALTEPAPYDVDVLNGIAYDADQQRVFVTGKLWPTLYEIELVPLSQSTDTSP